MFGLSTELITKGKLATVKRFECDVSSVSPSSGRIRFLAICQLSLNKPRGVFKVNFLAICIVKYGKTNR